MFLALLLGLATAAPADLSAVGVVLMKQSDHSVAVLRANGTSRVARVGESAFGGRVLSVAADAIAMDFGGERVQVPVRAGARASVQTTRTAAAEDPRTPSRAMERVEVQRRIANETQSILRETAIAPVSSA